MPLRGDTHPEAPHELTLTWSARRRFLMYGERCRGASLSAREIARRVRERIGAGLRVDSGAARC